MTTYTLPEDVHSPHDRWKLEKVVYSEGERMFAIAIGTWKLEDGTVQPRLATRWNGDSDRPHGVPNSFNHATWFILPDLLAVAIADTTLRLIAREGRPDALECIKHLVAWTDRIRPPVE